MLYQQSRQVLSGESFVSYWLHLVETCIRVALNNDAKTAKTLLCLLDMLDLLRKKLLKPLLSFLTVPAGVQWSRHLPILLNCTNIKCLSFCLEQAWITVLKHTCKGKVFGYCFGFFGNVTGYGTSPSKAATRLGCCPDANISSLGHISFFALFDVAL